MFTFNLCFLGAVIAANFLRPVLRVGYSLPAPPNQTVIVLAPGDIIPTRPVQKLCVNRATNIAAADVGVAVPVGVVVVDQAAGNLSFSDHFGGAVLGLKSKLSAMLDQSDRLRAQENALRRFSMGVDEKAVARRKKLVEDLRKEEKVLHSALAQVVIFLCICFFFLKKNTLIFPRLATLSMQLKQWLNMQLKQLLQLLPPTR